MTFLLCSSRAWAARRLGRAIAALAFIGSVFSLAGTAPASAAERIVLNYRWLQRSVDIADLSALAESGEVSPTLDRYLKISGQSPEEVRQALTREVRLSPVVLDQALNNPIGNYALDQMSPLFHTRSGEGDRQALRAALVLSASDDDHISLIEVLENYPTPELYVEGDRLIETYGDIVEVQETIQRWASRLGF